MESLIVEKDLEKFDGYSLTFQHPNLTNQQLTHLHCEAFTRFYCRPSWGLEFFGIDKYFKRWIQSWDAFADRRHDRNETEDGFAPA